MTEPVRRLHIRAPADPPGYDVVCERGALSDLARLLAECAPDGRVVICTDDHVAALYADRVTAGLRAAGRDALLWAMPAGEAAKTLATVHDAYAWLAGRRVERGDVVLALGGGVVGDLAGFVAATYLRGLRLVQVPTTLVAQVDSALGGKVGVDLPEGKNLVGAFHQPALVVTDPELLATLPEREYRAGLAEVIKHGIIRDPDLLDLLEQRGAEIRRRDPVALAGMVARAAAVKAAVVVEDPFERGVRRILNYGHTLGHAIEREAGYGVVLHGEAVAWGMAAAARIGRALGTCDGGFESWQADLLRSYGLLEPLPRIAGAEALMAATALDKKSAAGRINWVLPLARGSVVVTPEVPAEPVRDAAAWLVSQSMA